jgi:nitroreductase
MGSNKLKYFTVDFGICFEHLILAAAAENLATCWIGWFNEDEIKKILEIPEKYRVIGLTPLGYPIESKGEVIDRKPLDEVIHYDKF